MAGWKCPHCKQKIKSLLAHRKASVEITPNKGFPDGVEIIDEDYYAELSEIRCPECGKSILSGDDLLELVDIVEGKKRC